jgi:uncharacterized integral membrane protein (TIGR00698 family)
MLASAVALAATGLAQVELRLWGQSWLEPLALAILGGAILRSVWDFGGRFRPGLDFAARTLLEVAVVLLGAAVSPAILRPLGWALPAWILALVGIAIIGGFLLGRAFGLPPRMAALVACGNSICGNTAIVAVAPVVAATGEEVACAVAFTAVLGVGTVVALPFVGRALAMTDTRFGVLSGLVVYAVPQVLAAAAALGPGAIHIATLVKVVRVLTLGPVCLVLSLLWPRLAGDTASDDPAAARRPPPAKFMPWFIAGFLALAALRSGGLLAPQILPEIAGSASLITVVSMAALGLSTDLRALTRAGPRVASVATLSLLGLAGLSLGLIALLRLP